MTFLLFFTGARFLFQVHSHAPVGHEGLFFLNAEQLLLYSCLTVLFENGKLIKPIFLNLRIYRHMEEQFIV